MATEAEIYGELTEIFHDVFMRDLWVQAVPDGRVNLKIELDAVQMLPLHASVQVRPKNFQAEAEQFEFNLEARRGTGEYPLQFQLRAPLSQRQ